MGLSDAVWLAILGIVFMAVKEGLDIWRASILARKVADAKTLAATESTKVNTKLNTLKDATSALSDVAYDTHALVNNNMGIQLRLNAVTARRLADITKNPVDRKAAEEAEKLLHEHEVRQSTADESKAKREGE